MLSPFSHPPPLPDLRRGASVSSCHDLRRRRTQRPSGFHRRLRLCCRDSRQSHLDLDPARSGANPGVNARGGTDTGPCTSHQVGARISIGASVRVNGMRVCVCARPEGPVDLRYSKWEELAQQRHDVAGRHAAAWHHAQVLRLRR